MKKTKKPVLHMKLEMPVEEGDYGQVLIIKGPLAGKLGLYDDDESNKAIVYVNKKNDREVLGNPTGVMVSSRGYYLLPRDHLAFIESVKEVS